MKMDALATMKRSKIPFLHVITSEIFKVVNAKDFDQVQPSTPLVRGLLEKGAGFPLKLKKGPREGQSRRGNPSQEGAVEQEDEDEEDED